MRWMTSAVVMATLVLAGAAQGQSAAPPANPDADIEQAIQNERDLTSVPDRHVDCPPSDTGEIVVCGKKNNDRYRVQSSTDEDPTSAQATRTGALHPPDIGTHPPGGVRVTGFGHVPPPIYYIDTTKLPSPPPGSDADKIAKGEMAAP